MSYEDLLLLRSQKKRREEGSVATITDFVRGPNLAKIENAADTDSDVNRQPSKLTGPKAKKYIIITYVAEFDKVHYPLPLKYTGYPDATVMQQTIHKLKNEVDQLKSSNTELISQLRSFLKVGGMKSSSCFRVRNNKVNFQGRSVDANGNDLSQSDSDSPSDPDADSCNNERNGDAIRFSHSHQSNPSSCKNGSSLASIQSLANMVQRLETLVQDERSLHRGKMSKLEKENGQLRTKLRSIENSESLLKDKVVRLESVLAMNVGLKKKSSTVREVYRSPYNYGRDVTPRLSYSRSLSNTKSRHIHDSPTKMKARNTEASRPSKPTSSGQSSRNSSTTRSRHSSLASGCIFHKQQSTDKDFPRLLATSQRRCSLANPLSRTASVSSRSNSRDGKPTFNPTEYVKQKKMKQEKMIQDRLAKVESRIQNRYSQKTRDDSQTNFGGIGISNKASKRGVEERKRSLSSVSADLSGQIKPISGSRRGRTQVKQNLGRDTRAQSSESQRSLQCTVSPYACPRRTSPSPRRPVTNNVEESFERQSRKKIRDKPKSNKNTKIDQPSIHEILKSARRHISQKAEAKEKQDKMLFNKKSYKYLPGKLEPNPDANFDHLQRRLNTIQAILGKSYASKGKLS